MTVKIIQHGRLRECICFNCECIFSFEKEDVKKINPYFGICNICKMSRVWSKECCGRDSEWEHTSWLIM